jgi:hypothetical protein
MSLSARKPRGSMHFWLLVLLIPGTIALLLIDSWNDYRAVSNVTQEVYDSALLEPAKVLETSVEFNSDGSLRIDPPFYAQVMNRAREIASISVSRKSIRPRAAFLARPAPISRAAH